MSLKKTVSLLLSMALSCTLVLSACGGGSSSNPADGQGTGKTAASGSTGADSGSGVSAPGVFPIVKDKTNLSVFIQQMPYTLTDVTTNTYTKELEELTNVHLDMTVVPQDSYQQKLTLVLASGEYPEVFMSGGFSNADLVKYGTQEKILIPLNDLIDKQGINIKERWADNPTIKVDMTTPDGNIYGIPAAEAKTGHGAVGYKLWFNEAWAKKLNMSNPTTTEEFRNILLAFKTKDPNGNGKADEIPMTGAINTWAADIYLYLMNAFGYFNMDSLLMLKDDKFTGCADQEYIKEGLSFISGLYKDGLIDPAALTQNDAQLAAIGNNKGDVIVGAASCGHVGMLLSINDVERSSMYTCLEPLTGPTGYRGIPYAGEVRVGGATFVITDRCKQPEVAIKLADSFCSEESSVRMNVGIKGKHWDVADPGAVGMDGKTPAKYKYLSVTSSGEGAVENDYWGNTARLLEPYWKGLFQVDGDINLPQNYEARLQRETDKLKPFAADVQQIPPLYMDEETSVRMSQLFQPLQDYVKTAFVEFITGKRSVDKEWDAYVNGLKKLNYQEYIDIQQKAYDVKMKNQK